MFAREIRAMRHTPMTRWLGRAATVACLACRGDEGAALVRQSEVLPESAYDALPTLALTDLQPACRANGGDACSVGVSEAVVGTGGDVAFWGVDGKRTQLYRVDVDGRLTRLGRLGGGPGEYRHAAPVGVDESGEVLIADLPQRRLTRFAPSGEVIATDALPYPIGLFHIAFDGGMAIAIATELPREKGDSTAVHEYMLDPSRHEPVRRRTLAFRRPAFAVSDMRPMPAAFAAHDRFANLADGALLHADGSDLQIDVYLSGSGGIRRVGFEVSGRPVTDEEAAEAERRALARVGNSRMRAAMQASMRSAGRAERHPAVTRLVALGGSEFVVRESPRARGDSVSWVYFRSPTAPVGRLELGVDDEIHGGVGGRILLYFGEGGRVSGLRWARIDSITQPRGP